MYKYYFNCILKKNLFDYANTTQPGEISVRVIEENIFLSIMFDCYIDKDIFLDGLKKYLHWLKWVSQYI